MIVPKSRRSPCKDGPASLLPVSFGAGRWFAVPGSNQTGETGFDSLCSTMEETPIRVRVLAWCLALMSTASLAAVFTVAAPATTADAEDNCSKVIPIDALAGSVVGTAASGGAMLAGPINLSAPGPVVVLQGGLAVTAGTATGITVGGVALAAAAGLAAAVGTCKVLDWSGWMAPEETPTIATLESTSMDEYMPCSEMLSLLGGTAPAVTTLSECTVVRFGSSAAKFDQDDLLFANVASSMTRDGVTIPRVAVGTGTSMGAFSNAAKLPVVQWLSANRSSWCTASTYSSACATGVSGGSKVMGIRINCPTYDVGNACGLPADSVLAMSYYTSTPAYPWEYVHPLAPRVQLLGWQRRIVTNLKCSGGLDYQAETDLFYDKAVTQRTVFPSCPAGQFPKRIIVQRVPANVPCLPATAECWGSNNVLSYWLSPTAWDSTSTRPSYVSTCFGTAAGCTAPAIEVVNGTNTCMYGGSAIAMAGCDPARQTSTSETPGTTARTDVLNTAPVTRTASTGVASTTDTATPETAPSTTVAGGGGTGTGTGTTTVDVEGGVRAAGGGSAGCDLVAFSWNPTDWILRPIKCAADWAFVPEGVALDARLTAFEAYTAEPPVQWATEGVSYVSSASFGFDTWANAGPACFSIMDNQVCPRTWDQSSLAPTWLVALMGMGLWLVVIVGVWRFF